MERRQRSLSPAAIIDPGQFGVSFSQKQCWNFDLDGYETMSWLINTAGFRRFRLMSYWDEHEQSPGSYDFSCLDWQIKLAADTGCIVTLCLGARQPRWPENHWPEWAWELPKAKRTEALLRYITAVVERYRDQQCVTSYQLENEALLRSFGERPEVDRRRLRAERALVKKLDPSRPLVMTTSTSWGIPLRRPIPDMVGFSYYQIVHSQGKYHTALHNPHLDRVRSKAIALLHRKQSFIHELQLEPWGPQAIWEMSISEQDASMSVQQIKTNVALARKTRLMPIDLWGGEWWYWRLAVKNDPSIWKAVQQAIIT
jgi:hypothetical protein